MFWIINFNQSLYAPVSRVDVSLVCCRLSTDSLSRDETVLELEDQLHEKDLKLTDIRLEALSSAHQLDQLRDTMTHMKASHMARSHAAALLVNFVFIRTKIWSPWPSQWLMW